MRTSNGKPVYQAIVITLIMGTALIGCAGNRVLTKPYASERIIHYSQLKGLNEAENLKTYAVYVEKGESIPLRISMDTDFMDLKQNQIDLVAKEKLYFMVKMPENLSPDELAKLKTLNAQSFSNMSDEQRAAVLKKFMIYISRDALHWAPLFGGTAYREVLGFKEGRLSFGVMANTTEGLGVSLDIKTVR